MQRLPKPVTSISATNRSRVTNGTLLLQGIDGRSASARRFRDLIRGYEAEFDVVSEVDQSLVRTAAMLTLKSEQLQTRLVNGEPVDTETLTNLTGQLRRVLADLRRKADTHAPPAPSIHEHMTANHDASHDAEDSD